MASSKPENKPAAKTKPKTQKKPTVTERLTALEKRVKQLERRGTPEPEQAPVDEAIERPRGELTPAPQEGVTYPWEQ